MNGILSVAYENSTYTGDLATTSSGEYDLKGDLSTIVNIALFTWRRDDNHNPRMGWWGDSYGNPEGRRIGSRLWTLRRKKATQAVVIETKSIIKEALAFLIRDKIAKSVEIEVERYDLQVIAAKVSITKADDTTWSSIWEIHLDAL